MVPKRDIPNIYLKAGEMYFATHPVKVTTVLGSCVSVVLSCPEKKFGAICHAQLPIATSEDKKVNGFKYVDTSIELMISKFADYGIHKYSLVAKLFGGADVTMQNSQNSVGKKNVIVAIHIIKKEDIKIISHDLGGTRGRKLIFFSDTGDVYISLHRKTAV